MNRKEGDGRNIAVNLLNIAMVSIGRGAGDRAREILLEALAIAEKIRSKAAGRAALDVAVGLAALLADWERAARLYGAAQAQLEETGIHRETADEAFLAPLIAKAREAMGEAAFAATSTSGAELTYEEAIAEARDWLEQRS